MNLHHLTFEEELNIMSKYSLSYEEFALVKMIFFIQDNEENINYLNTYYGQCRKSGLKRDELQSLIDKRVLDKDTYIPERGETVRFDEFEFRKEFIKNFYKFSHELGKEIWEEYPFYLVTNRVNYPIKNFSKRFRDLPDLFQFYGKQINYNLEKHNLVIKSLKYAKENNLISSNIVDYLIGNQWDQHIKLMTGEDKTTSITFDTTELL